MPLSIKGLSDSSRTTSWPEGPSGTTTISTKQPCSGVTDGTAHVAGPWTWFRMPHIGRSTLPWRSDCPRIRSFCSTCARKGKYPSTGSSIMRSQVRSAVQASGQDRTGKPPQNDALHLLNIPPPEHLRSAFEHRESGISTIDPEKNESAHDTTNSD